MPSARTIKVPEHQDLDLDSLLSKGYKPVQYENIGTDDGYLKDLDSESDPRTANAAFGRDKQVTQIQIMTANSDSSLQELRLYDKDSIALFGFKQPRVKPTVTDSTLHIFRLAPDEFICGLKALSKPSE
jgi:hypothetical protein